jgi:LysR family tcuABC transcriptional regulator
MNCAYDDIGGTIKPMGAVMHEGARGRQWRCLSFSDVQFRRRNFLYSLSPERLTTVAAIVTGELKETARELIANESWHGFEDAPVMMTGTGKKIPA